MNEHKHEEENKIKKHLVNILIVSIGLMMVAPCALAKQSKTIPEVTPFQSMPRPANLRDLRYCEISPVFRSRRTLYVKVYNTLNLNECPVVLRNKLNAESSAKRYDAQAVKFNSPRYWGLNGLAGGGGATKTGKIVVLGGIKMKRRAVPAIKLRQGLVGDKLSTNNEGQRTTTFIDRAGNMVYELTFPVGEGEGDRMRLVKSGAVEFFTKPVRFEQLLRRIQIHLTLQNLYASLDRKEAWAPRSPLAGFLTLGANCQCIHAEHGAWPPLELYLEASLGGRFPHDIYPDCLEDALYGKHVNDEWDGDAKGGIL